MDYFSHFQHFTRFRLLGSFRCCFFHDRIYSPFVLKKALFKDRPLKLSPFVLENALFKDKPLKLFDFSINRANFVETFLVF